MPSLKERIAERLDYLDQVTRARAIADVLAALDRPTVLMVEEGQRVVEARNYDVYNGLYPGSSADLVEEIFSRMVDAGRNGA